jgi:hypothetical protein
MRRPVDSNANGVVDPRSFPPDPAVVRRAQEAIATLEAQLESAGTWRERRQIRQDIRRARRAASTGDERPHRGAIY